MNVRLLLVFGWMVSVAWADKLEFDAMLKKLDVKPEDTVVTSDFTFTNTSDSPVEISRYNATCSCMSVKVKGGKLIYAPGETGVLRAWFDMGNFSGEVDKTVQLWLDDDPAPQPSVNLTVRVNIPVVVQLEPKTLRWDVSAPAETQVVKISMNYPSPIEVLSVESNTSSFTTELKVLEEGKSYELHVTPQSTQKPSLGIVQVNTNCPITRHASQRAFAMVRAPVREEQESKSIITR
ncbi:MAG: DUF1573 domain-containing protein [Verrucomicrobiales bacterium]